MGLLIGLGLVAGAVTTLGGVGGGMILTVVLAVVWDPQTALATAAPALLAGNAHRAVLFRREVDLRVAGAFALGGLPGAFLGGLLAVAVPGWVLHWILLLATAAALARQLKVFRWTPGPASLLPAGAAAGTLTATSGGGGVIVAPVLLAAGLSSDAYVATGAATAIAMHIGRLAAYGTGGLVTTTVLLDAMVLAAAIFAGNALARRVRARIDERTKMRIAFVALGAAVLFAVLGVTY